MEAMTQAEIRERIIKLESERMRGRLQNFAGLANTARQWVGTINIPLDMNAKAELLLLRDELSKKIEEFSK